jgi:integrase
MYHNSDLPIATPTSASLVVSTLADVKAAVESCTSMTATQRAQMRSALNTFGRVVPGRAKASKNKNTLANQLTEVIRTHVGVEFNVHLFRHFAAESWLALHPGDHETPRKMLGHTTQQMVITHYSDSRASASFTRYREEVVRARNVTPLSKPGRGSGR